MADSGSEAVSPKLESEYVRLDFESWDLSFALRAHEPERNRHARELSAAETKEEVLRSPRLQRIVREVRLFAKTCPAPSPLQQSYILLVCGCVYVYAHRSPASNFLLSISFSL